MNIEPDGHHCPYCGEPHPHFKDGMCEQCWNEKLDADEAMDNGRNTGGKSYIGRKRDEIVVDNLRSVGFGIRFAGIVASSEFVA